MEWDSKVSSWDFSEDLEQNVEYNIGTSGSGLEGQNGKLDCSVDLKLGGLGEFGLVDKWREHSSMPSSSSPSKRARQPSSSAQVASCSVDGCRADLSGCREYHRRHKVCEVHSKTPVVTVNGQEQRFCQQCSRFHSLVEFDEAKRSCRKRLDGHNRRRRKPQQDLINPAILFQNPQGFLTFPRMMPNSLSETNWGGILKTEEVSTYTPQFHLHSSNRQPHFASSFSQERQFPFLQEAQIAFSNTSMVPTTSTCQPHLETIITSTESSCSSYIPSRLTQALDSDCALSLLSSWSRSSGISMGQILPAERIPMGQPLVSALEYSSLGQLSSSPVLGKVPSTGFSCAGREDEQTVGNVLVANSEANVHCLGVYDVGGLGSSQSGSQAIPFSWQRFGLPK